MIAVECNFDKIQVSKLYVFLLTPPYSLHFSLVRGTEKILF